MSEFPLYFEWETPLERRQTNKIFRPPMRQTQQARDFSVV